MKLPPARGALSAQVIDALQAGPPSGARFAVPGPAPLLDDDLQLTLFICYELCFRGWDGVDDRWEWDPELLRLRAAAEDVFEQGLHALVGPQEPVDPAALPAALAAVVAADDGPPLSKYMRTRAGQEQFREFVMHRSVYHLREADPHTFAIPRLGGRAKAALIEIQIDEYGGGSEARMHQELFRRTMRWFDLDLAYGAYVGTAGAVTLVVNNLMAFFGLHRRRRGALLGHLAAYEMTSSLPNRSYGIGLRRLGGDPDATAFYDEHVEADAVHEQIAAHDMCGSFGAAEPELAGDVVFGARCALAVEALFAGVLLNAFESGESSLHVG